MAENRQRPQIKDIPDIQKGKGQPAKKLRENPVLCGHFAYQGDEDERHCGRHGGNAAVEAFRQNHDENADKNREDQRDAAHDKSGGAYRQRMGERVGSDLKLHVKAVGTVDSESKYGGGEHHKSAGGEGDRNAG